MIERASLHVHANLLSENITQLRRIINGNEIIAMVKADGYGHQAVGVSKLLLREQIKCLGVASLAEALELRRHLAPENFEIFVFSDVQIEDESNHSLYTDLGIKPVVSNLDDLRIFLASSSFNYASLQLKFNTGMNRLGIHYEAVEEAASMILKSGRKSIAHVMTHFACASQSMRIGSNTRQQENFARILNELRSFGLDIEATSISNSGAIEQGVGLEYSHVRPGLMLYGPSSLIPGVESRYKGKIISSLNVRVLKSSVIKQGDPVGYGATPVARDGQLLIAAMGYGDGFNNRYQKAKFEVVSERGEVIPVDVVGRVNMDMVQFLAPSATKIRAGEQITLWNEDPRLLETLCQSAGVIPYEVFCQLSVRVPRIFD